jgi:integrase
MDLMITRANTLYNTPYFRLRARCLVALLRKFGKRRCELGRLKRKDIVQVGSDLEFTFTLAKKRKRGLFQYLKYLKDHEPGQLTKPLPELQLQWKVWQDTEAGHKIKNATSLQSVSLEDKYTPYVIEYLDYLKDKHPNTVYLFPSGTGVFGAGYLVYDDKPMSGRQLLRIVKDLNPNCWMHLFRNTKACEVARLYGRTLLAVQEVQDSLDLENEATAMIYVRRHVPKRQPLET